MSQSRRLLGVVMDPIESIKPKKDSTLAMLLAAQRHGWNIVYFRQQDLSVRDGVPHGHGSWLTVRDDPERWFELGAPWVGRLGAARRAADAQGSAVRHGVHLHDVHPGAR